MRISSCLRPARSERDRNGEASFRMRMAASSISAWPLLRLITVCRSLPSAPMVTSMTGVPESFSRRATSGKVHGADALDLAAPAVQIHRDVGFARVGGDPELRAWLRRACAARPRRRWASCARSGPLLEQQRQLGRLLGRRWRAAKYKIFCDGAVRGDQLVVAGVRAGLLRRQALAARECPGGRPASARIWGSALRSRFRVLPEPDLGALRQVVGVRIAWRRSAPDR